jgi:hypothetical protein
MWTQWQSKNYPWTKIHRVSKPATVHKRGTTICNRSIPKNDLTVSKKHWMHEPIPAELPEMCKMCH